MVWAPETAAAFFGGDADNFEYLLRILRARSRPEVIPEPVEALTPFMFAWQTRFSSGDEVDHAVLSDKRTSELGRFAVTTDFDGLGAFKTSTLRNIAVTAPYMHDGHYSTLKDLFKEGKHGKRGGDIESLQQAVRDVHPLRTYGKPQDIANLVNWLASDEARYASGQLWVLDGGLTAQVQQMKL